MAADGESQTLGQEGSSSEPPPSPVIPSLGVWIVEAREREDGLKDINFKLKVSAVPHDQLSLKSEVERTLSALHVLYGQDKVKFNEAFAKLLSLAQVGLVGEKASPVVAVEALSSLHREIVDREAGHVKNEYLRKLGIWALGFWVAPFLLFLLSFWTSWGFSRGDAGICLLLAGSPIGTWLSFASRKVKLNFFDLSQLEDDRLDPSVRLAFVALLTLTFGLLLKVQAINIEIGNFSAADFTSSPYSAFLLGILLGLAEKALPARILDQASALLNSTK